MMSQKGFSKIVLIIILAVVLTAGYFVWSKYQERKFSEWLSKTNPNVLDPTANWNWKTYRNEEFGFEVKYPPGYGVVPDPYAPGYLSIRESFFIRSDDPPNFRIGILDNFDNLSVKDYVANIKKGCEESICSIIDEAFILTKGGVSGYGATLVAEGGGSIDHYFNVRSKIIVISVFPAALYEFFGGDQDQMDDYLRIGNLIVNSFSLIR